MQYVIEKANEVWEEQKGARIEKLYSENKPAIFEYFKTRKWTLADFKQRELHKTSEEWNLGAKTNESNYCIDCNGVNFSHGDRERVIIASFKKEGGMTEPYIELDGNYE